jgi:hypothetical protein
MTKGTVYLVLKSQSWAIPYGTGSKIPKPYFEIAEAVPVDQPFTIPRINDKLYESTDVESASGERWKVLLQQDRSSEEDLQVIGYSEVETIVRQHFGEDVKEPHVKFGKSKAEKPRLRRERIEMWVRWRWGVLRARFMSKERLMGGMLVRRLRVGGEWLR